MSQKDFNKFCQVTQQRMHAFTLHDWTTEDVATLTKHGESKWCKGMGWNFEICPDTGRPHLQGWANLTNVLTWPKFKAHIGIRTLHCELVINAAAICKYCEKVDTRDPAHPEPVLLGKMPMTQNDKGRAGEAYYEHNLDALDQGRPEDMDASAEYNLRNYEYAVRARKKRRVDLAPLDGVCRQHFEWHCGVTGSGKTKYVDRNFPGAFLWLPKTKWENYNFQDVVVFSDLDSTCALSMNEFKTWFELGSFPVRILYDAINIRPKRMIMNTNEETFDEMFPHMKDNHKAAIRRRFTVYHWPEPYYLDEHADPPVLNPKWFDPTVKVPTP